MTERTDFTVDWNASPRIVTVAAPSLTVNMQDIVDTLRPFEESFRGMSEPKLLDASGKQTLSAVKIVGVTVTLLNARFQFADRGGPTTVIASTTDGNLVTFYTLSGTHTGASEQPTTLDDSTATFIAFGIEPTMVIRNVTDGSAGTVVSVDSETSITTSALTGGTDNDWDASDVYEIEGFGNSIEPSTFITVKTESDVSAGLVQAIALGNLEKLMRNKFITDPVAGTITVFDNDGTTVLFTAPLWQDAAGTIPYAGAGSERRDRLA